MKHFVWNHQYFEKNCIKLKFSGCHWKFHHRVIYIAPSSGHNCWTLICLLNCFKEFWGCFLMSGVRMLHFLKDWWKFIQIHQNYTMALICLRHKTSYKPGDIVAKCCAWVPLPLLISSWRQTFRRWIGGIWHRSFLRIRRSRGLSRQMNSRKREKINPQTPIMTICFTCISISAIKHGIGTCISYQNRHRKLIKFFKLIWCDKICYLFASFAINLQKFLKFNVCSVIATLVGGSREKPPLRDNNHH